MMAGRLIKLYKVKYFFANDQDFMRLSGVN